MYCILLNIFGFTQKIVENTPLYLCIYTQYSMKIYVNYQNIRKYNFQGYFIVLFKTNSTDRRLKMNINIGISKLLQLL